MDTKKDNEAQSYNALAVALGGDYRKLATAKEKYKTWERAWEQEQRTNNVSKEREWEKLEKHNIKLSLNTDPEFPELLKEMPWQPHALYWKGDGLKSNESRVAIVGTRKCTPQGGKIAREFGRDVARRGVVVVSGLAMGIDTNAHEGALDERGKTIAVLACGLDTTYPKQNETLAKRIQESGGTVVSEYPPGSEAFPGRFIERNRIVSGLSQVSLIVESPKKSGAKATARFALEQNREVLVVPGSIKHPNYAGSLELIQGGAGLAISAEDILRCFGDAFVAPEYEQEKALSDPVQTVIVKTLQQSGEPLTVDKIQKLSKIDLITLNQYLGMMVVEEKINEQGGRYYL
ncbi:MAG: DNA-protecting protein DprA [Candidatus Harrisonbacteria bacterium CG10_big_fil_rev_8_21_14_0_10_42_17]|uniref:DNA-protecting protein DprA n=1 Tax=Candidatus Harrisonbacteria bacterium CG10_big_fil_rev_8_21_14_0_10_42_17 TaxID=1974584 RepID=A0A2M6WIB1_9BACT|nr:MAG: DNA-protecting protein DprA [Candidatus Harrisonbacteria bacterium CG10_big_fil_rev_8_21_14_0_10_42_17]